MRHGFRSTSFVSSSRVVGAALAAVLAAGLAAPVFAQAPPPEDAEDIQHGVARLSIMDGQVSVRRGDAGEWVAGVINAPLMADDTIATGPNSRTEIQFDSANMLRLGGNAQVHLTALQGNRYQMELAKGTVTFRVLRPSTENIEVDTPSVSVRPSRAGIYRVNVNDAGETQVVSRAGDVEVFTPKGSQWVGAGQMMLARGSSSDPEFQIQPAIPADGWDQWNDSRDRIFMAPAAQTSQQNVPQGVYGAEDLGQYGTWQNVPDYGQVWQPTVAAGWSPYSCGRWVWEDWYGWTWVGCEAWGWAPYHYGRWFYQGNYGWLWYPGVRGYHHGWSPALVGFFGWGGGGFGVGVGFGFGNIGWVPLAPYEVFHPWWGRGFYGAGFANRVNITNVNVYNNYRNARVAGGVSGMRAGDFQSGRFGGFSHPGGEELRSAGLVRGQMPFGPTSHSNLAFTGHAASFTPASVGSQRFFTHQQAPAVQHMGVTRGFAGNAGSPAGGGSYERSTTGPARTFRSGAGAAVNDRPAAAARPSQNGAGGWRSFNGAGSAPPAARNETAPAQNNTRGGFGGQSPAVQNNRPGSAGGNGGGWNRFGDPSAGNPGRTNGNAGSPNGARQQVAPQGQGQGRSQNYAPRGGGYNAPQNGQRSMGIAPPVVHERQNYSAPQQQRTYNAPQQQRNYSAPQQQRGYSAPQQQQPRSYSAPSYSAPRNGGGGGGSSAPARSSGGGGGHPSGGGNGGRRR